LIGTSAMQKKTNAARGVCLPTLPGSGRTAPGSFSHRNYLGAVHRLAAILSIGSRQGVRRGISAAHCRGCLGTESQIGRQSAGNSSTPSVCGRLRHSQCLARVAYDCVEVREEHRQANHVDGYEHEHESKRAVVCLRAASCHLTYSSGVLYGTK
jgi:hypothetical protein